MNLLTKTVPLFLVLFTALASGCNNLQLTECNKSEGCTWCAFSNKEGKQSGHCLITLIAEKLPSGVCGGVLEEDDDDGDVLLRKEDDDGDELDDDDELTYPGPKHNHPGPRDNPLPPFYKCILLDSVACDKSDICSICVVEDPAFKCCVPKMFFEFEMFSDICENGESTSSPSGLADELDGCDVDGACVEASYVADVGLCNLVSEK